MRVSHLYSDPSSDILPLIYKRWVWLSRLKHQIVDLGIVGSNPTTHPNYQGIVTCRCLLYYYLIEV